MVTRRCFSAAALSVDRLVEMRDDDGADAVSAAVLDRGACGGVEIDRGLVVRRQGGEARGLAGRHAAGSAGGDGHGVGAPVAELAGRMPPFLSRVRTPGIGLSASLTILTSTRVPEKAATDTGAAGLTSSLPGRGETLSAAGLGAGGCGADTASAVLATRHWAEHWALVDATSPPSSTSAATAMAAEVTRTRQDQYNSAPVWVGMGRDSRFNRLGGAPMISGSGGWPTPRVRSVRIRNSLVS